MVIYRRQVLAGLLVALQIGWVAPAAQAPAPLQVNIVEWDVPQGKLSFVPHDPDVAPDGGAWYTGYGANVLGRVDPASGQVKEFSLPTADSGPHGLTIDPQGHVWYTGNRAALIGRLDPATGKVTEYRMPDPQARDPHTPILGKNGTLWFTVQSGNYVGRLDTATGAVTLKQVATPKAMPHGIILTRADIPFFALSGTNKIGRINPQSMDITEFTLPEGARPRRLAVAAGDFIWYGDSATGDARPARSEHRERQGVGDAGRPEVGALGRRQHARRGDLVQRVRRHAEHGRPVRSAHRSHAVVAHSLGRRRRAAHGGVPRRQPVACLQRRRQGRTRARLRLASVARTARWITAGRLC